MGCVYLRIGHDYRTEGPRLKRRCFAWRTYPAGKTRAFAVG